MFKKCLCSINKLNISLTKNLSLWNIPTQVKDLTARQYQKQILQKHLGLSYQRSAALIRNYDYLQPIENKRFEDTVKCLSKMGLQTEDLYQCPLIFTLHHNTIEHNTKYLQEIGFTNISAHILLKFRTVVKKPVSLLKAHKLIPESVNVPNRLYSYLYPKPVEFPILQTFSDEDSAVHIHETIFKHYLIWRLETTVEEVERLFRIYEKFKYKSFDLISGMIEILTKELSFTNTKLLQHGYLFQNGPDYLKQIMKSFPTLAGIKIKKVLFKCPKIIAVSPENLASINKHLRDFGITDESIRSCLDIYTLSPDTVLHRLNELKKIPEFDVFSKNHRVVRLILCQNKAKLRLEHLQKLNVKCASINVLCASDPVFERYVQEGNDRTKGSDIISYINQELKLPEKDVRQKLCVNPHWCHVPLVTIQSTLNYLLENDFPKSEIARLPIILIYPKKQIRDALMEIYDNPETGNLKLKSRARLNLCLYFIERKHHFSGNGIWDNTSADVVTTLN